MEKATWEATTRVVLAQQCHSLTRTLKQPRCFGGTPSQGVRVTWTLVFVLLSPAGRHSLVLQVELVDASILRFTTARNRTVSEKWRVGSIFGSNDYYSRDRMLTLRSTHTGWSSWRICARRLSQRQISHCTRSQKCTRRAGALPRGCRLHNRPSSSQARSDLPRLRRPCASQPTELPLLDLRRQDMDISGVLRLHYTRGQLANE